MGTEFQISAKSKQHVARRFFIPRMNFGASPGRAVDEIEIERLKWHFFTVFQGKTEISKLATLLVIWQPCFTPFSTEILRIFSLNLS